MSVMLSKHGSRGDVEPMAGLAVRLRTLGAPMLLSLGEPGGFDITPWALRVQLFNAKYVGMWELPVLGPVTAPTAVLIRPDGYVAWVASRHIAFQSGQFNTHAPNSTPSKP